MATAADHGRRALLREAGSAARSRVSMIELFFDLVFVFAVTQLSHALLAHLDAGGALRVGLMFLGTWWLWIFTTWCTNWVDPDHPRARILLFVLMLAGLILSSALPEAFAGRGLVFGAAFAAMQLLRTAFMVHAFGWRTARGFNFVRILVWMAASAVCWIAGGLAQPESRLAWWMAAIAIEYAGPALYFRVPGLGRSSTAEWDIDPHHMAERCGLFVIIALGESLLVTGATFAGLQWQAAQVLAFLSAFVGSVAMWWLYFDTGAERASHRFAHAEDPGRVARLVYTYLHLLIIGGVIVSAVSDELVLVHPDHASDAGIAAILGGPALYLFGNALFKWVTNQRRLPPLSHLLGLLLILGTAPFAFGHVFSALTLGATMTGVMVLVAAWESFALRRPGKLVAQQT